MITLAAAQSLDANGGILLDRSELLSKVYGMEITFTYSEGSKVSEHPAFPSLLHFIPQDT
jgi:hypothetical protein